MTEPTAEQILTVLNEGEPVDYSAVEWCVITGGYAQDVDGRGNVVERDTVKYWPFEQGEMQRSVDSFDGTWGPNGRVQPDGPERLVTIDHTVYKIAPEHGRTDPGFRGFCGRRFDIELIDGRTVTTTNLWEVGTVPPKWRDRWPDTARFIARADCQLTV